MKLTAVLMVKNEIDVIRDCCGHLSSLFDDVVIIDHRSTDGTREYLIDLEELNDKFQIYFLKEPGYYQSHMMTWAVKNIDICANADWVFLIDADEVLPFVDRKSFEQTSEEYSSSPIIKMSWINLVPEKYSSTTIMGRTYLASDASNVYHKIAYQPSLLPVSDFIIAQGNHAILAGSSGVSFPSIPAFNLYHIPIRSSSQLGFKIIQGTAAYSMMGSERNKSLGCHWFDISEHINEYGISDQLLNGIAYKYGEPIDAKNVNITHEKLLESGYKNIVLKYAYDILPEVKQDLDDVEKIIKLLSDFQSSSGCELKEGETVILKLNNREIEFVKNENNQNFPVLPNKVIEEVPEVDLNSLINFTKPATMKIESFTPTAWGGHIPFLFCLIKCIKPRVYVELGSHCGASFFAASQATQNNKQEGKTVAVDLWEGDEHAGFYDETIFNNFKHILKTRYSDVGEYLRMSFDDASELFDDQSIDLLHIDGLHTYEAVKNDYDLWRSKVTKNGVIIFHDTNVFEREFGVWKLWKEISSEAVSFEFKHTHGLGVMAFGDPEENPLVGLLTLVNNSDFLSEYVESYFSRIGELTNGEAIAEFAKVTLARQTEELKKLGELFKVAEANAEQEKTNAEEAVKIAQSMIHRYENSLTGKLAAFVKSIPVLGSAAVSFVRFVRK